MKKIFALLTILSLSLLGSHNIKAAGKVQYPTADFNAQTANGIVILDFFAQWCPPCKRFGPVFEEVANSNPSALFIKVDVDQHESIAKKYSVNSMPTVIVLKNGKEVYPLNGKRLQGAMTKGQFVSELNKLGLGIKFESGLHV